MDRLITDKADLEEPVNFARDVMNQYRQLSAPSGNIVTRTPEIVVDRPGIAGVGRKTHTEIRYSLNEEKYNERPKSAQREKAIRLFFKNRRMLMALVTTT